LRKQFPKANGPTEIQVRLVVDEAGETPSTVMVCSLAEAIEVSLDRMTDLIGVALNNDPPVIRAVRLSKLEYENEQAVAKQKSAAKSRQAKTFRFRAGIDENDLHRKIQTMTKFLEQGIECEYTVFSKARTLRENSVAGTDLVDRIQEMLAGCAVQKRAPQTNEQGNHIRVCLVPKKN
jgi:translation initiation factor IF-3